MKATKSILLSQSGSSQNQGIARDTAEIQAIEIFLFEDNGN
jgi:hypothetical protein